MKKENKKYKTRFYSCKECGKITTTSNPKLFKLKICKDCRIKLVSKGEE